MLDTQTAQQFHAGDLEALRRIVELYQSRLFGLGMRMLGEAAAAADFCQDVFIRAYEACGQYQPHRPFEPWFFKVAVNLARERLRRRREDPYGDETPEIGVTPLAEEQLVRREDQAQVRQAVATLPQPFQECLALRFESDLSLKEMAQTLGIPLGTVKSRLSRALVAFQQAYQASGGDGR